MTNSLSQDIVAVGQLMADNLNTMGVDDADVEDGLTTLAGKILNVVTEKIDTILEIDIDSLNLVYDDDFNITGVLTDENDDAVSYASVKLLIGSTVVDTQTTDSNGEVTFTYCPVSTGTHTFKLVYEGDNTYDNCASSTVTRTVNKETTYIDVSAPPVVVMYSDGEYSVSGSLMDNDSPPEPVKNKQINVYESNNLITSFTTGSDGTFSGSISGSTLGGVGEHILSFEFAGDDNYTSSTSQRKVVVTSTHLSLVSSKDTLSYADGGDSCTLTATYTGAILAGRTVVFKAYKDGTLVETIGSDDTDSSGEATVSYSSKGAGDLSIRAECMNLQETYVIRDAIKYYDRTFTSSQTLSVPNIPQNFKAIFTVHRNAHNNANSAWVEVGIDANNCLLFGLTGSGYNGALGPLGIFAKVNGSYSDIQNIDCIADDSDCELEFTSNNGVQTITDGTTIATLTNSQITSRSYVKLNVIRSTLKNLIIMPL